jgi:predicted nucleic acid-binding protein
LVSDAILLEVDDVLRRPKFERYVSEEERLQFLAKFVGMQ